MPKPPAIRGVELFTITPDARTTVFVICHAGVRLGTRPTYNAAAKVAGQLNRIIRELPQATGRQVFNLFSRHSSPVPLSRDGSVRAPRVDTPEMAELFESCSDRPITGA